MGRGVDLGYFLGILRKRWLLMLIVAAVATAGGMYYRASQIPVYEAGATIKILRQRPRATSADVSFAFEEDQVFFNTQYTLLRTQLEWGDKALDRAAVKVLDRMEIPWEADPEGAGRVAAQRLTGADRQASYDVMQGRSRDGEFRSIEGEEEIPEKLRIALDSVRRDVVHGVWNLTVDSFLAGVQAAPVPGTYLATISFRATDPNVAVLFANLYGELYRDLSRELRAKTVEEEIKFISDRRKELEDELKTAMGNLSEFRGEHPELASGTHVNLAQAEADAIAQKTQSLETELILRRAGEEHLLAMLEASGLLVRAEPEKAPVGIVFAGPSPEKDLHTFLGENLKIQGNAVVSADENVSLFRSRVRGLEEERYSLPPDLTAESFQVRRLRERLQKAQRELGVQVEAAIVRYLGDGFRIRLTIEDLDDRYGEVSVHALARGRLNAKLMELNEEVQEQRAEKEALDQKVEAYLRLKEAKNQQAGGGLLTVQNIELERAARLKDATKIRPNTPMISVLTVLGAITLALGAAFLAEYMDDTIKSKQDLQRIAEVPDIGAIPYMSEKNLSNRCKAVHEEPRSVAAEAFRSLRTGILFSRRDREIQTMLVTSSGPGEGKTTVSVNLATTMAQASKGRVLLIDADLRQPRVHHGLGIDGSVGFTNCLVGNMDLEEAVQETEIENLYVLTSGPTPPNPAELLGGDKTKELLEQACASYGKVILDTPPLVAVTDTCLLAPQVEGVFLVVSVGKTSWRLVGHAREALEAVGAKISATILNSVSARHKSYGAHYGYGYGYGATEADGKDKAAQNLPT